MFLNFKNNDRWKTKKDIETVFNKLKPYLKHGTIILTSNFQNYSAILSPTPIKHSSFCYIENGLYYSIELSNSCNLEKQPMLEFLKNRNSIFLFDYFDENIMTKTMNYVFNYKNIPYGFFGNKEYCYKLIFNVYRDVYEKELNKKYNKMSNFFPIINYFGLEFVNAHSVLRSKKFIPTCCIINNSFMVFKKEI